MWMWCWGRRTAWGLTGEGLAQVSTQPPPPPAAAVNNSMFRSGAVSRVCCAACALQLFGRSITHCTAHRCLCCCVWPAACRLVHWCGAQLQAPHRAVRELGFQPEHSGVFISRWHHGSPAHRYGLFALHWILEVRTHACLHATGGWQTLAELAEGHSPCIRVQTAAEIVFQRLSCVERPSQRNLRRSAGEEREQPSSHTQLLNHM